ncbi:unnamed protein product [Durusdinium trenchii]|uniref:SAP domain-containing protein n=1 Tax=Durusdinium trenchii TaxID=1381693 RepID=A0ABP0PCK8_9DINO
MEIFDLTQDDSNEEQQGLESDDEDSKLTIFAVSEIAETFEATNDEEIFYDCCDGLEDEPRTPSMEETDAQSSGSIDGEHAKTADEPMKICMIKNVVALEVPSVIMTIDSGADVSVAPERFYNLGVPGAGKPIEMIDAQGAKICSKGNRRLRLQAQTRDGDVIEFIEQFALGVGVTHPLLSVGRLLKQGWGLSKDDHGLFLEHPEKTVKIPARLERNSLVMDVKICAVRAEGDEPDELQVMAVSGERGVAVEAGVDTQPADEVPIAASGDAAAAACDKGDKDDDDDDVTVELMQQLSEEGDPGRGGVCGRSPGYTTEESGEVEVKGSSSEDGRVKERLARWEKWHGKLKEVKKGPVELSSPEEQVRPVRGAPRQLHGYISRELGLLEGIPGWHALPNGIVVHSKPMASHFHDPSSSFGDEWCGRLTLAKMTDGSDQWEQLENLANYKDTPLPFRPVPHGPRTTLTFVAPGLIKDRFVVSSEVPVSQYPLLNGEPASWPEDDQEDQEGGEAPWLAAGGGERPEIAEDVHFVDPDELEVSIDELTFNKDNKLKDLQDMCRKLGSPTSGSKVKVLKRLKQYKHHEEEKIAYEIAQQRQAEAVEDAEGNEMIEHEAKTVGEEVALGMYQYLVKGRQEVLDMLAEEILQSALNDVSEDEEGDGHAKDRPPEVSDEELAALDDEACRHEEHRLEQMGVLEKTKDGEPDEEGMLLRLQMQTGLALYTLDVKDAFLLMDQPADEKAMIVTNNGQYKLKKNLPGQRNAAAQWFKGFCAVARDYGMVQDVMQPTMMKKDKKTKDEDNGRLFLTIHVDDLLLIGDEEEVERFISYMEQKSWKVEKRGPLYQGNFSYLKRNMEMIENGIVIRPDKEHIKALAKVTNVENRKFRTTPGDGNFTKLSKDDEPMGLANLMQQPTKKAWRAMQHVSSYLLGTIAESILLEHGPKARSVLNVNEDMRECEDDSKANLLEVICDADYAGQQATRKSVSSVQLYLNGGLMESYVRCQRCIALSSGETLAGRIGVGRTRHIAAGLLWSQEKTNAKELRITGVPTSINVSDIGTKILSKARVKGLKFLIKRVDGDNEKIGKQEFEEIHAKEELKKNTGKLAKAVGGNARIALVLAFTMLQKWQGIRDA